MSHHIKFLHPLSALLYNELQYLRLFFFLSFFLLVVFFPAFPSLVSFLFLALFFLWAIAKLDSVDLLINNIFYFGTWLRHYLLRNYHLVNSDFSMFRFPYHLLWCLSWYHSLIDVRLRMRLGFYRPWFFWPTRILFVLYMISWKHLNMILYLMILIYLR